jgi:hypothetical protein
MQPTSIWPDKYDIITHIATLWPNAHINVHPPHNELQFIAFTLFVEGKNFPDTHTVFSQFDATDPIIAQHHIHSTSAAFSTPMAITDTDNLQDLFGDIYTRQYHMHCEDDGDSNTTQMCQGSPRF